MKKGDKHDEEDKGDHDEDSCGEDSCGSKKDEEKR